MRKGLPTVFEILAFIVSFVIFILINSNLDHQYVWIIVVLIIGIIIGLILKKKKK